MSVSKQPDRFYVSQQLYDEAVQSDPGYADFSTPTDKLRGYTVWSEDQYRFYENVDNIKSELRNTFEPPLYRLMKWLLRVE